MGKAGSCACRLPAGRWAGERSHTTTSFLKPAMLSEGGLLLLDNRLPRGVLLLLTRAWFWAPPPTRAHPA